MGQGNDPRNHLEQLVDQVLQEKQQWAEKHWRERPTVEEIYLGYETFANIMAFPAIWQYYDGATPNEPRFMGLNLYRLTISNHTRILIK